MYSVGQDIHCYNIITNLLPKKIITVGTEERHSSFGCFLIEGRVQGNGMELCPHLESSQAVLQFLQSPLDLSASLSAQKSSI